MTDWMVPETAWLYTYEMPSPTKGTVIHSVYHTNRYAWFIPDNMPAESGFTVMDEEGLADADYVWFTKELPRKSVDEAFKAYWTNELYKAQNELQYVKSKLEGLKVEIKDEEGAE